MKLEIKMVVRVDYDDFESIVVGFCEGGSNYWLVNADFEESEVKPKGMPVSEFMAKQLWDANVVKLTTDEDEVHELTLEKMQKGIKMFLSNNRANCIYDGKVDAGNIDSGDSDCILQYALFGEVIYG